MTSTMQLHNFRSQGKEMASKNGEEPWLIPVAGKETNQLEALSLVLSAVGIEHCLDVRTHQLLVAEEDAEAALFHLQAYRMENLNWPPPPPPRQTLHPQTPPTVMMMGMIALFFAYTGPWSAESRWFDRGAIDSVAILDHGEWWRLVTALTLHADLIHLIGNCLIGSLMIHFLGKVLGYGLSWLLLILTGFTGNLLNILLHQQPHISVGLSTSVFAAIGMFTGLQLARWKAHPLKEMLLPLGAGLGLLAFLGSEGVRTDLGAHFFGFISGLCCGILLNRSNIVEKTRRPFLQAIFFLASLATILLCWTLALY
jgi:membrane associated rhomboid family serine protease